jgi:para-aminobenzoate synthetase component 1
MTIHHSVWKTIGYSANRSNKGNLRKVVRAGRIPAAFNPTIPPILEFVHSSRTPSQRSASPIGFDQTPEQVVRAWPDDIPLAAFGLGVATPWSRWAVLGIPTRTVRCFADQSHERPLHEVFGTQSTISPPESPPFVGGWIGWLGYELGVQIEPRAAQAQRRDEDRRWPTMLFHRCDTAWCYDKIEERWWAVGEAGQTSPPAARVSAASNQDNLRDLLAVRDDVRARYQDAVRRAIRYIRAGDVYQVNLAHRLSCPFEGATRSAFSAMVEAAAPWYGAYVADDHAGLRSAILSASPELFFHYDAASRILTTRPMKGTRPIGGAADLEVSAKDRAELAMIVDLMRNDLGRVCAFGTVRVDESRTIETHGRASSGVLQAVSSISGRLRESFSLADVVPALFPGGSITGAPKVRAMQIIEELEQAPRGPYCGAIGYVSDSGDACFSMAIRTLAISGSPGPRDQILAGNADYWVGAGIVADSDPASEWEETLVKASPIRAAFSEPPRRG